jgi:hypothetical protein
MYSKHNSSALISVMLIIVGSVAVAEQPNAIIGMVLSKKQAAALESTATTPEDQLRLAIYYRAQERKFDDKVRYHQEMAEWYRLRPLPYDGKMGVPMQRHCKEWILHFAQQAERAAVLANVHEEKAFGSGGLNSFGYLKASGLRSSGFAALSTSPRVTEPTPAQTSLYRESIAASTDFYDHTRILAYVVSATGQPMIDARELRQSATALFDRQGQFFESLTAAQKTAIEPSLRDIEKARRDIEHALDQLEQRTTSPTDKSYFKSAKKIKQSLERWHSDEQQIGVALGLS